MRKDVWLRNCFSVLFHCILPSGLYNVPAMFKRVTKGAFHLSELEGQTGQSINRMRHFEWNVLQTQSFRKWYALVRRTMLKPILQIGTFRLRTDWSRRPVLTDGKRPQRLTFLFCSLYFLTTLKVYFDETCCNPNFFIPGKCAKYCLFPGLTDKPNFSLDRGANHRK